MSACHDCADCPSSPGPAFKARSETPHVVAVVGPPNSGKSTLFNRLTGLRQKVANFPGVTVEHHIGKAKTHGPREIVLVDLPGIYSLNPRSEDEQVSADVLTGVMANVPKPDAVLLILDCTNLGRHLALAAPILSLKLPTLIILNMADDLERRGGKIDVAELAHQLGAPVALISASRGAGVEKVFQFLEGTASGRGSVSEPLIQLPVIQDVPCRRQWAQQVGCESHYRAPEPPLWTRRLDAIFLHSFAGPLIFAAVVVAVFQTIFTGARPIMDLVSNLIQRSGEFIGALI